MHDWLIALILGIVEGITEFLPVSSTGHLLIAEKILTNHGWLSADHWLAHKSQAKDLFNVVIQSGAVIAVLPLFPQRLYKFVFESKEKETQNYLIKILVAFAITAGGGFIIDKKNLKLPEELAPVAWALLLGGLAFLAAEFFIRGKKPSTEITWLIVLAVGLGQLVAAIFPGASRSGTTIILALLLGLGRPAATEFSFLVGIPTMLAAGGWKIFKSLHHPDPTSPPADWGMILLTTAISAVVSFIAVKWLLKFVQTHTFNLFGFYRIAAAIAIFLLVK
jgi:undecaprenyl-diphosphatase